MTPVLRGYEDWLSRLMILASFIVIGAGGLGVATTVGLIGLLLLPLMARSALLAGRSVAEPLIYATIAIGWACASLLWSPYDKPDQVIKFVFLTPLFGLAVYAFHRLDNGRAQDRLAWFSICAGILAFYLLIEAATGAFISEQFKLAFEDVQDPEIVSVLADRILGRGTTAFIMVAGPLALSLWFYGGRLAQGVAVLIAVSATVSSIAFGISANALALGAAVIAGIIVWRFPRSALQIGFWLAGGMIICTPLIMGAVLSLIPASLVEALPLSWAMRIEIWRFAMEQISQAPIIGQGLDSSRVISQMSTLRGQEFDLLPLHSHNAGLTIWMETGAIGAVLFGGMIISVGHTITRRALLPAHAISLAYVCTALFVTVWIGSGVWQEWLHASFALALAAIVLIRRDTGANLA